MSDRDTGKNVSSEKRISLRERTVNGLLAVIPDRIDNRTVLRTFEAMRKHQKRRSRDYSFHDSDNSRNFRLHKASIAGCGGFIEDQNSYTDMAYGDVTVQYSGCELIALYNALFALFGAETVTLPELISVFERDGMVFRGKFGTSPRAVADYLEKQGLHTELTTEASGFERLAGASDCLILTMYNDGMDISKEVHTVCVSKSCGKYTAHNVYCDGNALGPFDTLTELLANINSGRAKGIALTGIRRD